MKHAEFYTTPEGEAMFRTLSKSKILEATDRTEILFINDEVKSKYPEADKATSIEYARALPNVPHYQFLKARRFVKCNLGNYDSVEDIDGDGNFHFEEVQCPLRGECKWEGIICKPKIRTKLSARELEVMKLIYEGRKVHEIAESLFIAIMTVKQHRRNSLNKLELHSVQDFIRYANKVNLF